MTHSQIEALKFLKSAAKDLPRQQMRTLKGQILAGDVAGAMKGLDKLLTRKGRR